MAQEQSPEEAGNITGKVGWYLHYFDRWLLGFVFAGFAVAAGYGLVASTSSAPSGNGLGPLLGMLLALLIAAAALAIGAFAGFLFGLPRSLTSEAERARQADHETEDDGNASPQARTRSTVNTNLEKISDWLTTIIVGVGLTNLPAIPRQLDAFGQQVERYFGFGGHVFAVAAGLYFLIAGFFLFYVLTRVRLSLVFTHSDRENRNAAEQAMAAQVKLAADASPISTGVTGGTASPADQEALRDADAALLSKPLTELTTPEEVLAWSNAKARRGDYAAALTGYKDVLTRLPASEKLSIDYATMLAASGDPAGANNVVATLATAGLTPDAEREARQKIAAATAAGQAATLRSRLQQGLYRPAERGYEDSILAGEELMALPEASGDAMAHIWLACAYGQKVGALKQAGDASDAEIDALVEKAIAQLAAALAADPSQRALIRSLYEPGKEIGGDTDLQPLYPDERIDALLAGS